MLTKWNTSIKTVICYNDEGMPTIEKQKKKQHYKGIIAYQEHNGWHGSVAGLVNHGKYFGHVAITS